MKQEKIESIIYKFLEGSASEEENEQLTHWLTESNENRLFYFTIKRIWLEGKEIPDKTKMTDASWERLKLRTSIQSINKVKDDYRTIINVKKLSIAATILILIGLSSFLGIKLRSFSVYQKTTHEITVPMGSRTNLILPDGTDVWLNAGSKLTYTSDFGRLNRTVSMTGEAFFDVQKKNNSIFTVDTRDISIKVFGTQFNVKSYPEEDVTETTLIKGQIEVTAIDGNIRYQPVLLTQSQRLVFSRADGQAFTLEDIDLNKEQDNSDEVIPTKPILSISKIENSDDFIAWKDGRLVFRSESLKNLALKLERYYNIKIEFENDSIKDIRYTGTLEEVTVEEVFRAISRASNISFEIEKNKILLSN